MKELECCVCGATYRNTCCPSNPKPCPYQFCSACWEKVLCEAFECKPAADKPMTLQRKHGKGREK
jgi:hypothetical protein